MSDETPKATRKHRATIGRPRGSRNRAQPEAAYAPQIHVEGVLDGRKFAYDAHEIKDEAGGYLLVTYGPGYIEKRWVGKEGTLVRQPWQPPQPQYAPQPQPHPSAWTHIGPPLQTTYTTSGNMLGPVAAPGPHIEANPVRLKAVQTGGGTVSQMADGSALLGGFEAQ